MQNQLEITPGGGLTLNIGSDKYPYTIVSYENNILKIQQDRVIKNNNQYEFLTDINGNINYLKRYPKNNNFDNWFNLELNQQTGRYNKKSKVSIKFNERKYIIDPSF